MKKINSKIILFLLATLPINSCIISPDLLESVNKNLKIPNKENKDSTVLIGGKTLRQQINLRVNKLELEENQETDFTDYIDLNQSILKPEQLVWTSKNNEIATINRTNGKLRPIKEGTTIITVSLKENPDIFAIIELKVVKKRTVVFMKINPSNFMLALGNTKDLTAEVQLADGQINSNVSWASSDNTIATVSQSGKVSAIKEGKVTITATYNLDNNYKAIATLEVVDDPSKVVELPQATSTPVVFGPTSTPIPSLASPTLEPTPTPTTTPLPTLEPTPIPTSTPKPTPSQALDKIFKFFYDNDKGGYIITDYLGSSQVVNIPEIFDNDKVIGIGSSAFSGNELTSITIPNSVTSIGSYAFSNNQLTSVTIPNSVTYIDDSAFSGNELTSIIIPNSVTSIGSSAFSGNELTSITIPNSVTFIGSYAFSENQLTSITIPSSVTFIDYLAFSNNKLTEVTIMNKNASFGNCYYYSNNNYSKNCYSYSVFGYSIPTTLRTIKGYTGSGAENFAKDKGIRFVALD